MESPLKNTKVGPGRPKTSDLDKRRKRKARNVMRNKASVYLGSEIDRWMIIKEKLGLNTHPEVAKTLIDSFVKSFANKEDDDVPGPSRTFKSLKTCHSATPTSFGQHQNLKESTAENSEKSSVKEIEEELRLQPQIVVKTEPQNEIKTEDKDSL